jgi:hypothetical protein
VVVTANGVLNAALLLAFSLAVRTAQCLLSLQLFLW